MGPNLVRALAGGLPLALLLFGPADGLARRLWRRQAPRVWHYETLAVAAFLLAVVLATGNQWAEWIGLGALVLAHGRNSVTFRMVEAQRRLATRRRPSTWWSAGGGPHNTSCCRSASGLRTLSSTKLGPP